MTPEDWYVVDMEREYYIAPKDGRYRLISLEREGVPPKGWNSPDATSEYSLPGELVVTRSELLACIGMMRAKRAMEAT